MLKFVKDNYIKKNICIYVAFSIVFDTGASGLTLKCMRYFKVQLV